MASVSSPYLAGGAGAGGGTGAAAGFGGASISTDTSENSTVFNAFWLWEATPRPTRTGLPNACTVCPSSRSGSPSGAVDTITLPPWRVSFSFHTPGFPTGKSSVFVLPPLSF